MKTKITACNAYNKLKAIYITDYSTKNDATADNGQFI